MEQVQALDVALFRFVNQGLKNPLFDWVLPYFSSNVCFIPALIILGIYLLLKGGVRGRLLVVFLLLSFVIGDPLVIHSLKHYISRSRPFIDLAGTHVLVGRVDSGSMPSGHAANWCAAALVAIVFYRKTAWFMLPMAIIESFSRVYLGVHYPSDVLVGGMLGLGYAAGTLWASEMIWQFIGRRWFPLWWLQLPSVLNPGVRPEALPGSASILPLGADRASLLQEHWVRLGYVLIGIFFVAHLIYIGAGKIELSYDEAYQWLWSKHLALSYYSKPPLIAYTQFLGTSLWGDTPFGVRFFSPVLAALTSILMMRFLVREAGGFVAGIFALVASAMPVLMVGATLMTIDSLSVLFWWTATVTGWRAITQDSTRAWIWTGIWVGMGFLGKYIAFFQWICWGVFLVLWAPARGQLKRPGPYLAVLVSIIFLIPVLAWNAQNHWITLSHLANRGGLDGTWKPTLRYFGDFVGSQAFLLNPVFLFGMAVAAIRFWGRKPQSPLLVYLFSMGAPLFLFYLAYTFRARVQPNWIVPAVLPLLALTLIYWDVRWRHGGRAPRHGLIAGLAIGWVCVVPLHDTRLIGKVTGTPLAWQLDPLTRVQGWKETAQAVGGARQELLKEGKPVFIIGGHYGITSLLSFYMPEARAGVPKRPLVYFVSSETPQNQFYFWPGYETRKGENAIYVAPPDKTQTSPPESVLRQFKSVTDLGTREVLYKDRVFHRVQLFACRELR